MDEVLKYLDSHREQLEADLCELLRIPSVSADSSHASEVRRAGDWVADQFRSLGLKTEVIETAGYPLVYAESAPVPGKPVALVYGHYDVQPPDPLDEWISPPFEPTIRDGNVYARGATDDKGQMLTHVKAAEAWIRATDKLPIQLKFLIEGEEEVGSDNLEDYVAKQAEKLGCDCVVVSDSSQFAPGIPAITYGLRGIAYFEIRLSGPKQDLHSGTFGGGVVNPANALAKMLAALVDDEGRIQVPGFYDEVEELSDEERKQFAALPFNEKEFAEQLGVNALGGEKGFTNLEQRWARPTCDVNGLWSGYQGEGAKTVLPARAGAKVSFRLVPNQSPEKIAAGLRQFVKDNTPPGIDAELVEFHGGAGVVVPLDNPYMNAAAKAIESGFGKAPVYIREGGSIPIVATFTEQLKAPVLLLGWGQNDDNTHSPNEKFCLDDYHRGARASACLWQALSEIQK